MTITSRPLIGTPNYSDVGPVYSPVLSGGSWVAGLPLTNLQDRRIHKTARSTNDDIASSKFDVDLGTPRPVRIVGLPGHNFTLAPTLLVDWPTVGDAAWTAVGTPTRVAGALTIDGIPLDLIGDDSGAASEEYQRGMAAALGGGTKYLSFKIKEGTAATQRFELQCGGSDEGRIDVTWTAGVPSVVTAGSGIIAAPVVSLTLLSNGVYVLVARLDGIRAGVSATLRVFPAGQTAASTGTVYLGDIKAWDTSPIAKVRARGFSALPIIDWLTVGDGSWTAVNGPTRVAAATTVNGIPLDLIGDDGAGTKEYFTRTTPAFTGNGDKTFSFLVKRFSAYAGHLVEFYDESLGASRFRVSIDFTSAVPVVVISAGAGVLQSVVAVDTGYRITVRAVGVVVSSTHVIGIYPADIAAGDSASLYIGDIQAWNSDEPSLIYDSGYIDASPDIYPAGSIPTWHPSYASRRLTPEDADGYPIGFTHVVQNDVPAMARYWRIEVNDTLNADGYVEIGRLVLAGAYQLPSLPRVGARLGWDTATTRTETDGGAAVFNEKPRRRQAILTFEGLNPDDALVNIFELLRKLGTHTQLYLVWDPTATAHLHRKSFCCVFRELGPLEFPEPLYNTAAVALTEEI